MKPLTAGAAVVDITPKQSLQLRGYPHVDRLATGTHDPLLSTALCLDNGETHSYLVTQEAVDEGGYECMTAIFQSPESGNRLLETASNLLKRMGT